MGGPYEPFGDFGIAFIVDLETTVVHQPRPGALDHPAPGQHLEGVAGDPRDDLGREVTVSAVGEEGLLEPSVAEHLGQTRSSSSWLPRWHRCRPTLSLVQAASTTTAKSRPVVSTMPKVLRPETFLPASYPLVGVVTVAAPRTLRASITPAEGSAGALRSLAPCSAVGRRSPPRCRRVTRPRGSGARCSSGGSSGERPPLAARGRHVEDRVDDVALGPLRRAADLPGARPRRTRSADERPLLVGQVTVRRAPGWRNGLVGTCHFEILWHPGTLEGKKSPTEWDYFLDGSENRPECRRPVTGSGETVGRSGAGPLGTAPSSAAAKPPADGGAA